MIPSSNPQSNKVSSSEQDSLIRFFHYWWQHHTAPQPVPNHDNINQPNWQPNYQLMLLYFPLLLGILFYISEIVSLIGQLSIIPEVLARYFGWWVWSTAGFIYVSKVTTYRSLGLFRGRHGGYRDFWIVQLACLVLFSLSIKSSSIFWQTTPAFKINQLVFVAIPFLLGLHISYLEKLPKALNQSINVKNWLTEGILTKVWIILRVLILVFCLYKIIPLTDYIWVLSILLALSLILILINYYVINDGYYFYLHHWFVFFVLSFLCNHSITGLMFFTSAFIEGAARWSCAPIWHRWENTN